MQEKIKNKKQKIKSNNEQQGIVQKELNYSYPLVYVGLNAIAKAVGAGQIALRRWIKEENFPAKRCTDGIYRAEPEEIRNWFRNK